MVERRYPGWEGASVSKFWGVGDFDSAQDRPFDSALLCSGPSTRLRMLGGGLSSPGVGPSTPLCCAQALRRGSGCSEGALSSRGLALRRGSGQAYSHPSTSLHSALLRSASLSNCLECQGVSGQAIMLDHHIEYGEQLYRRCHFLGFASRAQPLRTPAPDCAGWPPRPPCTG